MPPVAMRAQGFLCDRAFRPALIVQAAKDPVNWGAVWGSPVYCISLAVMPACGNRLHRNCNCQLAAENPGAVGAPEFSDA